MNCFNTQFFICWLLNSQLRKGITLFPTFVGFVKWCVADISDTEVIALNIVEFLWNKILNLLPKTLVKSKTNSSFQASKLRIKEGLSVKISDIKEQTRGLFGFQNYAHDILNLQIPDNLFFDIYIPPKIVFFTSLPAGSLNLGWLTVTQRPLFLSLRNVWQFHVLYLSDRAAVCIIHIANVKVLLWSNVWNLSSRFSNTPSLEEIRIDDCFENHGNSGWLGWSCYVDTINIIYSLHLTESFLIP